MRWYVFVERTAEPRNERRVMVTEGDRPKIHPGNYLTLVCACEDGLQPDESRKRYTVFVSQGLFATLEAVALAFTAVNGVGLTPLQREAVRCVAPNLNVPDPQVTEEVKANRAS